MSRDFDWQKLAAKLFCLIILAVAAVALPSVVIRLFLPFLLAVLLCALVIPAARALSRLIHVGERALRIILLMLSFLFISVILLEAAHRLYMEIFELLQSLKESDGRMLLLEMPDGQLGELMRELSVSLLSSLGGVIGELLKTVVSTAPSAILFGVSFVMFSIYFCLDYEKTKGRLFELLPDTAKKRLTLVRASVIRALGGIIRSYAVMFALTFFLSLIGLCVLGRKYALTMSLVTALVDMLPVLGTGAVLIPWALGSLFVGNVGVGIGLALLWLIITVVRSAVEPRMIGESIGISPAFSLVAAYAGFKAFGVLGMILAPVAAAVIHRIFQLSAEGKDKT